MVRTLTARYAGVCGDCGQPIAVGDQILYGGRGRTAHANGECTLEGVPAGPTTRERRMARAERLRGWAEGRDAKAAELHKANEPYRGDIAFNTQPGHIPERARAIRRTERAWDHSAKAASMAGRADSIEAAVEHAIYDDDPDAIERLAEKIARLEAQRANAKARNAAFRKAHRDEFKTMTAYERGRALPFPAYVGQNLSGNITRCRQRLARLTREAGV